MPYTENELYTFGIVQEKMIEKAWNLGYEGVKDIEEALDVILWRLEYLETTREIRITERQLADVESEHPEGSAHLSQLRHEGEEIIDHLEYLSRRLTEHCEREPNNLRKA